MPQYRMLYTKATESLDINEMPDDFTRLLWLMLPLGLCREGRGMDNPAWVKAKIMPLRVDVSHSMVEDAMVWYAAHGMIERYTVDGRSFFRLVNWASYQKGTHKEAASQYPSPPASTPVPAELPTSSGPTPDPLPTNSGTDADADAYSYADSDANATSARKREPRVGLPVHMATEDMMASWDAWLDYHEERGSPLTKSTAMKQFAQFKEWDEERSIAAIDNSISKGYVALVEPKQPVASGNGIVRKQQIEEALAREGLA